MKTLKELAQSLRDIIPKQWDNGDVVWTAGVLTGMEHAADRIDAWAKDNPMSIELDNQKGRTETLEAKLEDNTHAYHSQGIKLANCTAQAERLYSKLEACEKHNEIIAKASNGFMKILERVSELPAKWLNESTSCGIKPKDGDAKSFCAYALNKALSPKQSHVKRGGAGESVMKNAALGIVVEKEKDRLI